MALTLENLQEEVIADLTIELRNSVDFDEEVLKLKVKNAINEIIRVRNYNASFTKKMIEQDMYRYISNVRDIALYDYNQIGAEFQSFSTEPSESRSWADRNKLFYGIVPIAKCFS